MGETLAGRRDYMVSGDNRSPFTPLGHCHLCHAASTLSWPLATFGFIDYRVAMAMPCV